jgi:hypothetical protein
MRRLLAISLFPVALLVPVAVLAGGGGHGFSAVVDSIESRYHVHATRIPFLGFVSFVARKSSHGSVANLHVAEFENFAAEVDGTELNDIVAEKLGPGWERIIRETSRHGGEQTLIFIHPEGQRLGLFVVDKDCHEMDVVEASVDPDHLDDDIGHYRHTHQPPNGDDSE